MRGGREFVSGAVKVAAMGEKALGCVTAGVAVYADCSSPLDSVG